MYLPPRWTPLAVVGKAKYDRYSAPESGLRPTRALLRSLVAPLFVAYAHLLLNTDQSGSMKIGNTRSLASRTFASAFSTRVFPETSVRTRATFATSPAASAVERAPEPALESHISAGAASATGAPPAV